MVSVEKFEYPETVMGNYNQKTYGCKRIFDEKEDSEIFFNEHVHERVEFPAAIVDNCHCKKGVCHA